MQFYLLKRCISVKPGQPYIQNHSLGNSNAGCRILAEEEYFERAGFMSEQKLIIWLPNVSRKILRSKDQIL